MNPLEGNPFRTRADALRAVSALFEPLVPAYVAGGARVSLGTTATTYALATSELEAFARVSGPVDRAAMEESLATIDSYWLGEGWYRDGLLKTTDFYNAWALHFYGLIYAVLAADADPQRAARHSVQRPAVVVVQRDARQVQMLNGGRGHWIVRQGAAKYGKFVYSSAFAFGLDPDDPSFEDTGDSMLVLRDAASGERRVRTSVVESGIDGDVVWARWQPFPDVEIVTVLCGEVPWHVRLHHVRTGRALETFEGGFAIGADDDPAGERSIREAAAGMARVRTSSATSIIANVDRGTGAARQAVVHDLQPNTNIARPRAVVPSLIGKLAAGEHVLACVVAAVEAPLLLTAEHLPAVPDRTWRVLRAHIGEETQMPIAAHRTIRSDTLWSCAQRVPWLIVRWAAT